MKFGPEAGGHTIDRIWAGEWSFAVDGGTAPTRFRNVHQPLQQAALLIVRNE
ncbi:MAG: hypothetical protein H0T72_09270 [Chloroflexia bacterium]|nr:hypothetical protein [Chloroflexia bacterium]